MANLITAPTEYRTYPGTNSLFLAGGITGCENWQAEMWEGLSEIDGLNVYNPRRDDFDVTNKNMEYQQIAWEFNTLKAMDAISFYFSDATMQPITLFELGRWSTMSTKLFIGVHPAYKRKRDVYAQMSLIRPYQHINTSLIDLIEEVKEFYNEN